MTFNMSNKLQKFVRATHIAFVLNVRRKSDDILIKQLILYSKELKFNMFIIRL